VSMILTKGESGTPQQTSLLFTGLMYVEEDEDTGVTRFSHQSVGTVTGCHDVATEARMPTGYDHQHRPLPDPS
jgi:hypothetical protein